MRMFVAAVPPPEVLEDLEEFLSVRREAGGFRWTLPEQWHVTLAFLAEVPDRTYDDLVDRLGRAARKRRPMRAAVVGGGAFPNVGRARVLWAGVELDAGQPEGTEELRRLATGCRAAASKAGIEVAGERFKPHLTLARMSRPIEATRWVRLLDAYRGPDFAIDEIALIASHLGEGPRKRPRYEVRERFALGG
ncbi:RNA 2',3'-cyclic phosphodiesterase [Nocardioides pocheonensis]|uniref:RNA 2',3'-cyclic phosphodiesterase n=1 Tax=Nocardioides pocheonensis TaxID=661485 RepID=A0A3N0GJ60_9ACTN|nr:RNA 2',3'-cyclic phosphodiesterase [Nocardioides pocheonensis]RNM12451.1 RNA 2',3'-cyclic phosphodiesterase [Nocardioides pocheonensis]